MTINIKYTLPSLIDNSIKQFSDKNSLVFVDEEEFTYKQLGERIESVMQLLIDIGVKKGDKVAIFSANMPNWGVTYFAISKIGAIIVPILPDFKSSELSSILKHSESKVLFISDGLFGKLDKKDFDTLEKVVLINNFAIIDSPDIAYDKLLNQSPSLPNKYIGDAVDIEESDLAAIIYTSGTTGNSKGVMLTHKNLVWTAIQSSTIQQIVPEDRMLSVLPLSHTYENTLGLIMPLLFGASVHYLKKPPVPSILLPALKKVQPTLMLTVPLIIEKIYRGKILPEIKKSKIGAILYSFKPTRKILHRVASKKLYQTFGGKLKFYGIGGSKLDPTVEQFLRDGKFPYSIGYGLTETSPLLAGGKYPNMKLGSTGNILEGVKIRLTNKDKKTGVGEIEAKGENVMLGYYKAPELTSEVMTDDGWFITGDKGKFDKKGRLYIKGRTKTMIVGANGENIYPEEIESVINKMRYVAESLVTEKGGKLVAMIHLNMEELEKSFKSIKKDALHMRDDAHHYYNEHFDPILKDIQSKVNEQVNKFSRIQQVLFQPDPFERTPTQKIKRFLYTGKKKKKS